jgi:hypothetical protein
MNLTIKQADSKTPTAAPNCNRGHDYHMLYAAIYFSVLSSLPSLRPLKHIGI